MAQKIQNINKDIQIIFFKSYAVKYIITEIKNLLERLNSRLDQAEEKIHKL